MKQMRSDCEGVNASAHGKKREKPGKSRKGRASLRLAGNS
jgi:hypothetical protein